MDPGAVQPVLFREADRGSEASDDEGLAAVLDGQGEKNKDPITPICGADTAVVTIGGADKLVTATAASRVARVVRARWFRLAVLAVAAAVVGVSGFLGGAAAVAREVLVVQVAELEAQLSQIIADYSISELLPPDVFASLNAVRYARGVLDAHGPRAPENQFYYSLEIVEAAL